MIIDEWNCNKKMQKKNCKHTHMRQWKGEISKAILWCLYKLWISEWLNLFVHVTNSVVDRPELNFIRFVFIANLISSQKAHKSQTKTKTRKKITTNKCVYIKLKVSCPSLQTTARNIDYGELHKFGNSFESINLCPLLFLCAH